MCIFLVSIAYTVKVCSLPCGANVSINLDHHNSVQSIVLWVKNKLNFIATPQCSEAAIIVQWVQCSNAMLEWKDFKSTLQKLLFH